jgi:hypothetical protein
MSNFGISLGRLVDGRLSVLCQYKKGTVDDWLCFYRTAEMLFGIPALSKRSASKGI